MHALAWVALIVVLYLAIHALFARNRWNRNRHLPWHKRIWVSIPGPFGTRISKRM